MAVPTIDKLDVKGKRVLLRVDLNVPLKDGVVTDATRIERVMPTIVALADKGAKVILLAHLGRPEGVSHPMYSLRPVGEELKKYLNGRPFAFAEDCIGKKAEDAVKNLPAGGVLLLENVRFHPGEEENNPEFTKQLAALGDLYVNDAFSAAHRGHSSTEGLAHLLSSSMGLSFQAEIEALTRALEKPERPVMAVVGGSKVSTKVEVLKNLAAKVQFLAIGGGMANTFLAAAGLEIGKSLADRESIDTAKEIADEAVKNNCNLLLPIDAVVAPELKEGVTTQIVSVRQVPPDQMILDVGPATLAGLTRQLTGIKTLLWNGPLGVFETPPFDTGTNQFAQNVAKATGEGKLISIAGGGDTVAALAHAGVVEKFSYVSTAGGAFLEWLEGKELPGYAALKKSARRAA